MWSPEHLSPKDLEYAENFARIAAEIGIEVEKQFSISRPPNTYRYALMIKHFGLQRARRGLVARVGGEPFVPEECGAIWDVAIEDGYVPWNQAPGAIDCDRQDIVSWLNSFLWFGPENQRPEWHSAENYESIWNETPSA